MQQNDGAPLVFTTTMIKDAMNLWRDKIVNDIDYVVGLFENKAAFYYTKQTVADSVQVHMYPGIYDRELYFFVIPDKYDNSAYSADFNRYTQVCKVNLVLGGNEISSLVAIERMNAWKNNYRTWLPQQSLTTDGVFQVFAVDQIDFAEGSNKVNMALNATLGNPTGFLADLITYDTVQTTKVYEDYVHAIPPMGPSALITNYYLLTI